MRHLQSVSLCNARENRPYSDAMPLFVYNPLQHFGARSGPDPVGAPLSRLRAERVFITIIKEPYRPTGEGRVG